MLCFFIVVYALAEENRTLFFRYRKDILPAGSAVRPWGTETVGRRRVTKIYKGKQGRLWPRGVEESQCYSSIHPY